MVQRITTKLKLFNVTTLLENYPKYMMLGGSTTNTDPSSIMPPMAARDTAIITDVATDWDAEGKTTPGVLVLLLLQTLTDTFHAAHNVNTTDL